MKQDWLIYDKILLYIPFYFLFGWLKKEHLGDLRVDGRIILKYILRKQNERSWIGFIWLRLGEIGRLLWKRQWTFLYHKICEISWPVEKLLASKEGIWCVKLVKLHLLLNLAYHIMTRALLVYVYLSLYLFILILWWMYLSPLCIEYWWNNTDKEKLLAVSVCPPQIPQGLTW